jgi:phospholipid-binding lipoprotein MlaA
LEGDRAFVTAHRFMINSTVGIGGLFDVATEFGLDPHHEEDAGQTLAVWGIPSGPYLMLPFFGPSSFRDATGTAIDMFADPINWGPRLLGEAEIGTALSYSGTGLGVLSGRAASLETLDEIERTSLDYYAAVRSLYRQRRADQINNGKVDSTADGYDSGSESPEDASFDFDFDEPTESAASE